MDKPVVDQAGLKDRFRPEETHKSQRTQAWSERQ